jgi:hypothetical protein
VLSIDGVRTLTNIVIGDPIRINLVFQVVFFCEVVPIVTTQANDDIYHD